MFMLQYRFSSSFYAFYSFMLLFDISMPINEENQGDKVYWLKFPKDDTIT